MHRNGATKRLNGWSGAHTAPRALQSFETGVSKIDCISGVRVRNNTRRPHNADIVLFYIIYIIRGSGRDSFRSLEWQGLLFGV
jgi:hypothetical protein